MSRWSFPKDAWIKRALANRYLIVHRDGTIYRAASADKDGRPTSTVYNLVTPQIHKASGRVYFNMTYMGFTKSVLVNRVVAWAYHPNPNNLPQVNHRDGDKEHNAADNLEWSSGSDNEKHAHRTGLKTGRGSANSNAKLTASQVIEIRRQHAGDGDTPKVIAERFGVSRSTILNIINGKTWTHV